MDLEGISFKVVQHTCAPWSPHASANPKSTELRDTTYVDDEALLLIASSPANLDRAIDKLLHVLVEAFGKYSLTINWAPGKAEAMLKYRGNKPQSAWRTGALGGRT